MTKHCQSLAEVREHIDRIDTKLVALIAERAGFVQQAARFKETKADVVVPERIEEIVRRVRHLAVEQGTDPDLVEKIWRSMIDAFIVHEAHVWNAIHKG